MIAPHTSPPGRGFTLTELIVVLTVIVIMLAVAIPAFRSTIAGTEESNAETQLRLALATGRDAALRSDHQADSALVFFYEPGGRTSAVACEYVGTIIDNSGTPIGGVQPQRDIFVPIQAYEPMQFPRGWMVRGFVPAHTMEVGGSNRDWYEDLGGQRPMDPGERNWVFPETGFYDALARDDGADRQSFMIRFSGLTGAIMVGDTREALVLSPRPTASGRGVKPFSDYRFDRGADIALVVRRALQNDVFRSQQSSGGIDPLSRLLGDESGDTVLCRPVEQVALYKASALANALQIKLDRDTDSFYKDGDGPEYVGSVDADRMREWLEGDTDPDDPWLGQNDLPVARLYTFQRYTAELQPVPLLDLASIRGGGS
jgi:prepilin-type N-terminal cleavage/methylation domain-containing protein